MQDEFKITLDTTPDTATREAIAEVRLAISALRSQLTQLDNRLQRLEAQSARATKVLTPDKEAGK